MLKCIQIDDPLATNISIYIQIRATQQNVVAYLSLWMSVQCKWHLGNVVASFMYANILWFMHFRIYRVCVYALFPMAFDLWMDNGINGDRCNAKNTLRSMHYPSSVQVLDNFICRSSLFRSFASLGTWIVEMMNMVNSSPVYLPLLWNAQDVCALWSACISMKCKWNEKCITFSTQNDILFQINFH